MTTTKLYKIVPDKSAPAIARVKITSSQDSYDFIKQFYFEDIHVYESAFMLMLNRANSTIGWAKISQGGITGTVMDPMIIAKYSVDCLARGVIICHNHPSGNLEPSSADISMTNKIKGALALLDCLLLDHMIITPTSYYSFTDNGKI